MYRMLFACPCSDLTGAGREQAAAHLARHPCRARLGVCGYYLASFLAFAGHALCRASWSASFSSLNRRWCSGLGVLLFSAQGEPQQLWRRVSYAGVLCVFAEKCACRGERAARRDPRFRHAMSYAVYLAL